MNAAWGRALIPSLSDFFFVAVFVWLFVAGASGWKALLMDGDTGWHIRVGEYILDHHAVPTQDLFSFSKPSAPWFAWEWLTDVVYGALFRMAGLKAIVLLAGILIAVYATVLLRYAIWRGANTLLAAFMVLLSIGSATVHFLARPHLVTLLLVPVCFWMIEADRRENNRAIWLLIPITALWTNLHGGFLMLLACLAVLVVGSLLEVPFANGSVRIAVRYAWLLAGCAAASLLNPYGTRLHTHIADYLRSDWIRNMVQEFQAPTFRSEGQVQFEILLLGGLIAAGFLLKRRRITEFLWLAFLGHSALTSVRHAPLYAAVAGPLLASELTAWWKSWIGTHPRSSIIAIFYQLGQDLSTGFRRTTFWPVLVVIGVAVIGGPLPWPADFPTEAFPVAMAHQNSAALTAGRVLTTDQWGDYLIYSFYPRVKVFVDGRSDFYGESLGQEYLHLMQGAHDWESILRRYRFTAALLPVDWPLSSLLKQSPAWKVVKDDGRAILFVTRPVDRNESTRAVPNEPTY